MVTCNILFKQSPSPLHLPKISMPQAYPGGGHARCLYPISHLPQLIRQRKWTLSGRQGKDAGRMICEGRVRQKRCEISAVAAVVEHLMVQRVMEEGQLMPDNG